MSIKSFLVMFLLHSCVNKCTDTDKSIYLLSIFLTLAQRFGFQRLF